MTLRLIGSVSLRARHEAPAASAPALAAPTQIGVRSIGNGACTALLRSGRPDIQSFQDQDGSFVLIDGEIFDISGETARSRHAAAAVLGLYRRYGIESFARLNSNAAVAVWDAPAQRLIFARDRTGLGLCYWMERNGAVLFSSDLVSLLHRDDRTELNPEAIDLFLASGFISSPWTSLRHIHKVPLGHCLIVDAQGTRLKRYWRQSGKPRLRLSKQETIERLAELVNQAVARQHSGDARSGLLLSSGVDSTLLAALLARHGMKPDTFTFRYTHYEGKYNESPGALRAAQHCGLPHTEMLVGPEDVSGSLEEVLLRHQGPMTYGLHTAILKDIAESGAQVLYSGQGNGSLCPSATERFALALGHLPFPHRAVARLLRKRIDSGRSQRLLRVGLIAATGLNWRFHAPLTDDDARAELYLEPERTEHAVAAQHELFQSVIAQYDGESDIDRMSGALQSLYTADGTLHWTAAFSRSYGLLPRCPYFDSDLIDFLYRLPRQTGKAEIRSYASQLLPPDLAYAKKLGQTIPISLWFRGPLAAWLRQQLDRDRIAAAGLFHPARVQTLVDQHVSGAADRGWTLWIILVLTAWQELVRREAGRLLSAEAMISRTG